MDATSATLTDSVATGGVAFVSTFHALTTHLECCQQHDNYNYNYDYNDYNDNDNDRADKDHIVF